MHAYPGKGVLQKFTYSPQVQSRMQSPASSQRTEYSVSKSQSRFNKLYIAKKQKRKLFKHQISPDSQKYLPAHLRSPSHNSGVKLSDPVRNNHLVPGQIIRPCSIALKSPNAVIFDKNEAKLSIQSTSRIQRKFARDLPSRDKSARQPDTARSGTYQEKNLRAKSSAYEYVYFF